MDFKQEKIIELSKSKLIVLAVLAAGFVALGLWLLLGAADSLKGYGAGLASILFFGACLFVIVKKLLSTTPGLVINHKGITDYSSGVSAGFVPWGEITEIRTAKIGREKFASIMVTEPERYVKKGNAMQQAALRANVKMVGTPVNISANSLKIKHTELMDMLVAYSAEFHKQQ